MPVFEARLYRNRGELLPQPDHDYAGYRRALEDALARCATHSDQERLLKAEAIEITRHVTDGIRELIQTNKRIRRLVLDQGAVPLASWAEALDTLAEHSLPALKHKIAELAYDLEHGRIQGFPATMLLHGKPTFVTLEGFYEIVFDLAENRP